MSREAFEKLPKPKFKQGQYITDGKHQSFEISFGEWDYESRAEITDPPKDPSLLIYEMLFGDKKES